MFGWQHSNLRRWEDREVAPNLAPLGFGSSFEGEPVCIKKAAHRSRKLGTRL